MKVSELFKIGLLTKCFILLLANSFWFNTSYGQQLDQYSLYPENTSLHNPASSGITDYRKVNFGVRKQWISFPQSPQTVYLSFDSPLGKHKMPMKPSLRISHYTRTRRRKPKPFTAVSGHIMYDQFGPHRNISANGNFSYHLPLKNQWYLSMGIGAVYYNLQFNPSKVKLSTEGDVLYGELLKQNSSRHNFDANAGIWLSNNNLAFGYSANSLIKNKFYSSSNTSLSFLNTHHRVHISYQWIINRQIAVTPSTILKYIQNAPFAWELSTTVSFGNNIWTGISYRHEDAAIVLFGINLKKYRFAYAFDYILSEISNFSSGSHEIIVGLNF